MRESAARSTRVNDQSPANRSRRGGSERGWKIDGGAGAARGSVGRHGIRRCRPNRARPFRVQPRGRRDCGRPGDVGAVTRAESAACELCVRDHVGKPIDGRLAGRFDGLRYAAHVVFLWLPSADFALQRVRDRVRSGGHNVPEETVRRRYAKGIQNFFDLYQDRVETWRAYDASGLEPTMAAARLNKHDVKVYVESIWALIRPGERR